MSIPRPEHPRPQFYRPHWLSLNGAWAFKIDAGASGLQRGWVQDPAQIDESIQVPFCPESALSGVGNTDFMPVVWYHRTFCVPESWSPEALVWLHFGAVDWRVRVWVNGVELGQHQGGSASFSIDVTSVLQPVNQLVVRVEDDVRTGLQPAGKQSLRHDSFAASYTRTTGIWQSVWLEEVPVSHIIKLQIIPDWPGDRFVVLPRLANLPANCHLRVSVRSDEVDVACCEVAAADGVPVVIDIPSPKSWSPANPHLYDLRFELLASTDSAANGRTAILDRVDSYAGLRQFSIVGDRFFLNGEPLFLRLVLDQGFYPDGIWTAPSDEHLRADIERAQTLGFNGARLHQKVFEERFHYWADRLGYLTWGEFPDWGLEGLHFFAPRQNSAYQERALANHFQEWCEVVERDRNHPSIILWSPFNEANRRRGREQLYDRAMRRIYEVTKTLDPTRAVQDASGWTHVCTDVYSVHDYEQHPDRFRETYAAGPCDVPAVRESFGGQAGAPYSGQPFVVDEFGGTWWTPTNDETDDSWGYGQRPSSLEEALARIVALTQCLLQNAQVAGFCYTQLTDIEQEKNGLYTDTGCLKFDPERLREAFSAPAAIEVRDLD